jgi:hypothetical protein
MDTGHWLVHRIVYSTPNSRLKYSPSYQFENPLDANSAWLFTCTSTAKFKVFLHRRPSLLCAILDLKICWTVLKSEPNTISCKNVKQSQQNLSQNRLDSRKTLGKAGSTKQVYCYNVCFNFLPCNTKEGKFRIYVCLFIKGRNSVNTHLRVR